MAAQLQHSITHATKQVKSGQATMAGVGWFVYMTLTSQGTVRHATRNRTGQLSYGFYSRDYPKTSRGLQASSHPLID